MAGLNYADVHAEYTPPTTTLIVRDKAHMGVQVIGDRIWVCINGQCVFRAKGLGKIVVDAQ